MRISNTMLGTYMACPLQAKFKYFENLPTKQGSRAMFGKAVHAALDHANRTLDWEGARKIFLDGWDDPATLGEGEIEVWNKGSSYGSLRQRGIDILRNMEERARWEDRTFIASEHKFVVPFGEHVLSGIVDCLSIRKNHRGKQMLTIEDYKTGTRKPSITELALNTQFTIYMYATEQPEFWFGNPEQKTSAVPNAEWWWEMVKDMPRRGLWTHLWDDGKELDAGTRTEEDYARLYRAVTMIEKAVKYDVFVPHIGDACGLCDFAHGPCPVTPPTREEWAARLETDDTSWAS